MGIFSIFKKKKIIINDLYIYEIVGKSAYIRNGIGYGFISDEFLYDNGYLEIGFGRTTSGYGDWGGGFSHATTSPLIVTIDKNFIIQKIKNDSFYNSNSSKEMEKKAKEINLNVGDKLIIEDPELLNTINKVFEVIPIKRHIGWDFFKSPHMEKHFLDPTDFDRYNFRDAECIKNVNHEETKTRTNNKEN